MRESDRVTPMSRTQVQSGTSETATWPHLARSEAYVRAIEARDPRFDGVFFVGITSTMIYCRPICPARISHPEHRRFFDSAAAAERAGFRPCRRCRPELAPGRALVNAVSRLAHAAAHRIAAGALDGRSVPDLAHDLCVSERHLRRALEREFGVTPVQLAQTHRLLLAKRLLTDTTLPVTRIAYASGFQSLRRFNEVFRRHYRMTPGDLRRTKRGRRQTAPAKDYIRLTLAYRAPFDWRSLLSLLRRDQMPRVECMDGLRYTRTVRIDGHEGIVAVEDAASRSGSGTRRPASHLVAEISDSLVPVLTPLIARLRQLFDLDADPTSIDECLEWSGLRAQVRRRPGLRIPGAFDAFETALGFLLRGPWPNRAADRARVARVVEVLGEPASTGIPGLERFAPTPERVADADVSGLVRLDVPEHRARAIAAVAAAVADGTLSLAPGGDVEATHRALMEMPCMDERLVTAIVQRTLAWPDAFAASDRSLQRAAEASNAAELRARADAWRPWRAYAAAHLGLDAAELSPRLWRAS